MQNEKKPRTRRSTSTNRYFRIKNFFLEDGEECVNCTGRKQIKPDPGREFYHCLVCHEFVAKLEDQSKVQWYLQKHYVDKGHPLDNPPRTISANSYGELDFNDKLLVAEGKYNLS